jgi:hydrogenase maturation protein HypF
MNWIIRLQGRVQGVGFRPFVWRAAKARDLKGEVFNGLDGVRIRLQGQVSEVTDFYQYLLQHAPPASDIISSELIQDPENTFFDSFRILESAAAGMPQLQLTPDLALCAVCRDEMRQMPQRRSGYSFISCTACGPRYSILEGLPYDRPMTTMRDFHLCTQCLKEYHDPADRRYFAQTNSCPDCAIPLFWYENGLVTPLSDADILQKAVDALQQGQIIALKGIGGYLLCCDATRAESIARLRQRKQRPHKPFALMYPDLALLEQDAFVDTSSAALLQSVAAPIVLLPVRETPGSGLDLAGVAPGLQRIGAMLPCAPLLQLLLDSFQKPIVATSANLSHAPLVYEDAQAMRHLGQFADAILGHQRRISMPQDDSVATCSAAGNTVVLRRGRGWAPSLRFTHLHPPAAARLALGAEMKGAFAWSQQGQLHLSQYLGDLSSYDSQERYKQVLEQVLGMFQMQPEQVLCDQHPGYFTSTLAQSMGERFGAKVQAVQHHEAHFAAVLEENALFQQEEPVLGVIWDGTGLGADGQLWGSEFFIFERKNTSGFQHVGQMQPFPVIAGDKMAREPRLSALALLPYHAEIQSLLPEKEIQLYHTLRHNSTLGTSSMGRLFDALAALLGLCPVQTFEGQAAMLLEHLARKQAPEVAPLPIRPTIGPGGALIWSGADLVTQILDTPGSGPEKALRWHITLADLIIFTARHFQIRNIACSGGVFQNSLLIDLLETRLPENMQLFLHQQVPPNDENIAFGQWAYAQRFLN